MTTYQQALKTDPALRAYHEDQFREIPQWELQDRLMRAFRRMDCSVQEFADAIGVSRNTVGNWLNGRTKPSRAAIIYMAREANVPVKWLESGSEEPLSVEDLYASRDSNPEPAD